MTAPSAVDAAPIAVSALALSELVSAGVASLLQPYDDRVVYSPRRDVSCDVGLVDPELLHDAIAVDFGLPLVAITHVAGPREAGEQVAPGVCAVIGPDAKTQDLIDAIESAVRSPRKARVDGTEQLTVRELEILRLICRGATNADIAGCLFLSINSVKTYIRSAYRKMGVQSRSQAVLWGVHRGL